MRIPFDIVGDREKSVAIVEIKSGNRRKIAKEIMDRYPRVKSVLEKVGGRSGKYRNYTYKLLAGSKNTEVVHNEYGYRIKVNPRKVYFSPREGEERARIAKMIKPKENVLVMFSGAGPFAIAIGKKCKMCNITCVEHNPVGDKYCQENIRLNKLDTILNVNADVREFKTRKKFDRILMPSPTEAYMFVGDALRLSKKGTMIHLYGISKNEDFSDLVNLVKGEVSKQKKKVRIVRKKKVLKFGIRIDKVRIDLRVQ